MSLFAVTGYPILHSLSPVLFNGYFRTHSPESHYSRLAVRSAREALDLFRALGLDGLNVTAPFKTDIVPLLQQLDPAAERIGAVNTVAGRGETLEGYNTDHLGVAGVLDGWGLDVRGKACLVIGAGGAGRAAVYALVNRRAEVTLVNRDGEKAQRVAQRLGCIVGSFSELQTLIDKAEVIVLAVPSGALDLGEPAFHQGQAVIDAGYANTAPFQAARLSGLRYARGEEWLVHQARAALEIFTGKEIPAHGLDRPELLSHRPGLGARSIALVGFMGSGKSTIGRALAGRLGYDFLDIDDWIEQQEGKPVRDIFAGEGEAHFRRKEKDALARWAPCGRLVMACGGGSVLDEDNRRLLRDRSLTIWLYTSLETALGRMDTRLRPLLEHAEPMTRARELFSQRREFYFQSADLVVGNEGTADETVDRIHEEIRIAL